MRARDTALLALTTAATVSAVALGDGVGSHTSLYSGNVHIRRGGNDVIIVYQRNKHEASVDVADFCLGSRRIRGHRYAQDDRVQSAKVRRGRITFHGFGVGRSLGGNRFQALDTRISAGLGNRRATGTIRIAGTHCGTIHFSSPLTRRTR